MSPRSIRPSSTVAGRYFKVPDDKRIRIITEDGRRFLNNSDAVYDIIVVDAYYADALPSHLTTAEFFAETKTHLAEDGVLAYNVIGSLEGERSRLFEACTAPRAACGTGSGSFQSELEVTD